MLTRRLQSLGAGKDPAGLPESFVLSKSVHLAT